MQAYKPDKVRSTPILKFDLRRLFQLHDIAAILVAQLIQAITPVLHHHGADLPDPVGGIDSLAHECFEFVHPVIGGARILSSSPCASCSSMMSFGQRHSALSRVEAVDLKPWGAVLLARHSPLSTPVERLGTHRLALVRDTKRLLVRVRNSARMASTWVESGTLMFAPHLHLVGWDGPGITFDLAPFHLCNVGRAREGACHHLKGSPGEDAATLIANAPPSSSPTSRGEIRAASAFAVELGQLEQGSCSRVGECNPSLRCRTERPRPSWRAGAGPWSLWPSAVGNPDEHLLNVGCAWMAGNHLLAEQAG